MPVRTVFLWLVLVSVIHLDAQSIAGIAAVRVASGLVNPVFVTAPPGDYNRLFIVEQNVSGSGRIRILNLQTGMINATPFLTVPNIGRSTEQGLLGLAFDPAYSTNGRFYLDYIANVRSGVTHVAQYQVSANPDIADTTPANIKTLLTITQPQVNHNGGWIGFSPRANDDHNLYIALGDGGNANDQGTGHIEPGGNAQNTTTLLGKMLRVHVDPTSGTYTIPAGNPFVGSATARREIWIFGLRNPFRDSFDRLNGRMFIGDVGQDTREEIDVQQPTNPGGGENYGWRLREGFIATPTGSPVVGGPEPSGGVDPIIDYPHSGAAISGQAVIGGYVYRGQQIPSLRGTYVFGDYLGPEGGNGPQVFALNYDGTTVSNLQSVTAQLFPTSVGGFTLGNISSFGEDANGELYITDIGNGNLYKIVPVTPSVAVTAVSTSSGNFLLQGSGVPFQSHTIKATTNLGQMFSTIGSAAAAGDGTFQFKDQNAASFSARFYEATYP